MSIPEARKGTPDPTLDEGEFRKRFLQQFQDPAYEPLEGELQRIADAAWDAYSHHRKSPKTRKAGPGFADPDYDLSVDWIAAKEAIDLAQKRHEDRERARPLSPDRRPRRAASIPVPARCPKAIASWRSRIRFLPAPRTPRSKCSNSSRLTAEYGRHIHPCKACFSTAAALCHWPCSCYPNYSLGQTQDWMNEIYPRWVEAHGVMIVTPVNWYQVSSPLKLMMDRLVCADGGNPDPTSTQGKKTDLAKEMELKGWDYPKHLEGRLFSIIVHGDAEGAGGVRRSLSDWLRAMDLVPAGGAAEIDRYIGYWKPYATSHEDLDQDHGRAGRSAQCRLDAARGGEGQAARERS